MNGPLISIIVPIYNVEAYLGQCLDSLVNQIYKNLEILLINDGSTDRSKEICEQYQTQHSNVRLINKINEGCAIARNLGIKEARGDYVGFVDSDDWVTLNMYELLSQQVTETHADIIQCGFQRYYQQTKFFEKVDENQIVTSLGKKGNNARVSPNILFLHASIWRRIYKKSFLEHNQLTFPITLCAMDDIPFKFMVLASAEKIVAIPDHCYFYRLERPGQDSLIRDERLFLVFDIFSILEEFISKDRFAWLIPHFITYIADIHSWILDTIKKEYLSTYKSRAEIFYTRLLEDSRLTDCDKKAINDFRRRLHLVR